MTIGELHLVEQRETLALSQRDVVAIDSATRCGVLQAVIFRDAKIHILAQVQVGIVDLEQLAVVTTAHTQRHIVLEGIGNHRADLEVVACRVDILDNQELVVLVVMSRVRNVTAHDPLTFGDKDRRAHFDTAIKLLCAGTQRARSNQHY